MPNVGVIDTTRNAPEPSSMEKFFTQLGKDYRDKQDQLEINNILGQYKKNREDINAFEDLQLNLENSTISPSKRIDLQSRLNEGRKLTLERDKALNAQTKSMMDAAAQQQEKQRAKQSVYELYKPYMEDSEARRLAEIDTESTARSKISQFTKSPPQSQFEKTLEGEEAKKLVKLEEDIPKAKDALANLDHIESLMKNELSGLKGYAKSLLNTESAAEVSSLGLTAIEPILKLFNPVGAIPTQKIKLIQNQFQIKPNELRTTAQGKINALRRMATQGLARAEARAKLIRDNRGKVSPEQLQQFDKESENLIDTIADQEAFSLKMKDAQENDLVEGFYSVKDGKKLKPIPKKEAQKLFEQGLITNVPSI